MDCVYLIHDRSPELCCFHYEDYGVEDVTISRKTPKMNVIAERFIRSVRNEVLDAFVVFGKKKDRASSVAIRTVFQPTTTKSRDGAARTGRVRSASGRENSYHSDTFWAASSLRAAFSAIHPLLAIRKSIITELDSLSLGMIRDPQRNVSRIRRRS